jgi:putative ABC transport system permease protein
VIGIAWHTVRARGASLAGSFLALALGVALLAAMALTLASTIGGAGREPRWYAGADVVVAGAGTVSVTTGAGDERETESLRTAGSRAVPPELVERLSTMDADVVVDYAGYAATAGAPGDRLRPWSAAGLSAYTWKAGGAPRTATDVVLSAPTDHRPGDRVQVTTARGAEAFTVSGVLDSAAPPALYATDQVAAAVAAGRVHAVALTGGADLADRVRAAVPAGGSARVFTGDDRRRAEPDPDGEKLVVAISLLATTCGLAAFVSIFVVSGTFSYAVAARRREFGLLRTAGATPRQVRRLVLGEALAVGALASLAGGALGTVLAPPFAHWLADVGFAPETFTARFIFWPVAAAYGTGLFVALTGAWLAARRAGRVRPVEALREAAVDRRAMTLGRWIAGLVAIGGAIPMIAVFSTMRSADATALVILVAMVLIVACAMFAPLLIPPLVWLLTAPLSAALGAAGMLARHGARTAVRRTAATAAPILVTAGIAGSTLVGLGTLYAAERSASRDRIAAEAVAVPAVGAGLPDATVTALRAAPGVTAAVPATTTPVYVRDGDSPEDWDGRYVAGPEVARVLDLPLEGGDLADLTGTDTVAVPAGKWRLGGTAELWLGDATPVRLRVVAVFRPQLDLGETVLLPWALRDGHAPPVADAVYLRLSPAGPMPTVDGVRVVPAGDYLSAGAAEQNRVNRLASIAVLGMALLYTGIAIANTLVMATADRTREFATLRLAGATPRQVLRMVGVESVLVAAIGILLAGAVTLVTVAGMRRGLSGLAPEVPIAGPWAALAGITATCLVVAVLASLIPAALLLRQRPVELAGARE